MNTARLRNKDHGLTKEAPVGAGVWVINGSDRIHDHEFMEFAVVTGGEGMHLSATGDKRVARGDFFYLRPGAWHFYHDCRALAVYNCLVRAEVLAGELAWLRYTPNLSYLLFTGPLQEAFRGVLHLTLPWATVDRCVERMNALPQLDPISYAMEQRNLPGSFGALLRFLEVLAEYLEGHEETRGDTAIHPLVAEVVGRFEEDLTTAWTLELLAGKVLCDPAYLSRLCRKHVGLPPMALLARMRADRAAYLLTTTELSVREVGADVGWFNPKHFARRFRDHFGESASNYRLRGEMQRKEETMSVTEDPRTNEKVEL